MVVASVFFRLKWFSNFIGRLLLPVYSIVSTVGNMVVFPIWMSVIGEWKIAIIGLFVLFALKNWIGCISLIFFGVVLATSHIGSRLTIFNLVKKTILLTLGTGGMVGVICALRGVLLFGLVIPSGLEGVNQIAAMLYVLTLPIGTDFMVPKWAYKTTHPQQWVDFYIEPWSSEIGGMGDCLGSLIFVITYVVFGDLFVSGYAFVVWMLYCALVFFIEAFIDEIRTVAVHLWPSYVDTFGIPETVTESQIEAIRGHSENTDPLYPPYW
jgi:hypothetical protein